MKTATLFAICACFIVCVGATCARGENLVTNGSFEIEGTNTAWAADWGGTIPEGSMMRTNSAFYEGSWSMACKGGVTEWANVYQAIPQNLAGKTVRVTCWMMTPSSDKAVAWHPDWFANCSALLKLEQPSPSTAVIQEVPAIKNEGSGGVYDTWICVTNEVASFPAGMSNFKVVLLGIMTAGIIYYDDVRVEVISIPSLSNQLTTSFVWYGGGVSAVPPSADGKYLSNAVVTLTATPAAGYRFNGWDGDAGGLQNPLMVTMATPTAVTANFEPIPKPFVDGQVWDDFNALWYNDTTWYGTAPNSEIRQLYYTNVDSRSCLAYHLINCGSNAQLHTDFGMWPHEFSNNTDMISELWTPNLGATYSVRALSKTDGDTDNAVAKIDVSSEGWQTINAPMTSPDLPNSVLWWALGGFPKNAFPDDNPLPAGQTATFYFNKVSFGGGSGYPYLVDDFEVNPTWVGNGNWAQRARNWRYDTASDFTYFPYQTRNYSAFGIDGSGATRTGLCLVINFDAAQADVAYARAWTETNQSIYADLSRAINVEADVRLDCSALYFTPVKFWFGDGAGEAETGTQPAQTGGWQHVSWTMPGTPLAWTNVSSIGVMVETDGAGLGTLYLDNITFLVPEPAAALGLVLALAWLRRRCCVLG